ADFDIHTKILKYSEEETQEMLSRLKIQKLEDLKLQVLAQNPQLLGIGIPGQDAQPGQELGADPGGPAPNPSPDESGAGGGQPPQAPPAATPEGEGQPDQLDQPPPEGVSLPEP